MPRRGPTIASTALEEIHRRGPLALDEIVKAIVEAGLSRAKNPAAVVSAAIYRSEFIRDWQGRYCSLADQLEGAIFSHATTELERRREVLFLPEELALVEQLAIRGRPFAGGGDVHLDFVGEFFELPWPYDDDAPPDDELLDQETAGELVGFLREIGLPYSVHDDEAIQEFLEEARYFRLLHGPPGWLPALAPDDLLGIRVADGAIETVRLRPSDVRGPHVGIVAAQVARLAKLVIGPDPSWFGPPAISLEELVGLVATEAPELLRRPLPPLAEVVRRGGLEVVEAMVGHRGTDWEALGALPPANPQEAWGFRPSRSLQ